MAGPEVARPFVEAAGSVHPSLIDRSHYMDARFGVTNIPQAMWVDENNTIVRPPEPANPMPIGEGAQLTVDLVGGLDERERYVAMVKDWVVKGANSRYALSPAEVIAGSSERSRAVSEAVAHFELAQHWWSQEGLSERAIAHFNAAHLLQPDNITYRRQAYSALEFPAPEARTLTVGPASGKLPRTAKTGRSCPISTRTWSAWSPSWPPGSASLAAPVD